MRYFVSVRQNVNGVSPRQLLPVLIKLASACARLLLRTQVVVCPDCVVAVLLVEGTVKMRQSMSGDSYQNLDLPSLSMAADVGLDQQLEHMHRQVLQHLKGYRDSSALGAEE